jgi:hypothetical protein
MFARKSIKVYSANKPFFESGEPVKLVSFNGELPEPMSEAAIAAAVADEKRLVRWLNVGAFAFLVIVFVALVIACINVY